MRTDFIKVCQSCYFARLTILMLFFMLWGCSPRLVNRYDENLDQSAVMTKKRLDTFFTTLDDAQDTSERMYEVNKFFYYKTLAALNTMRLRAKAMQQSVTEYEHTVELIDSVTAHVKTLWREHRKNDDWTKIGSVQIETQKSAIENNLEQIIQTQIAMKQGSKVDVNNRQKSFPGKKGNNAISLKRNDR